MNRIKQLGPGLLYAGAAVGVSHIVQSTQAGARFGLVLILAVVLVHLIKYPFFKMGPRYAAVTGKSLIDAYFGLGKWAVSIIFLLTFSTMFTIQAAVTLVTAGIAQHITGIDLPPWLWSGLLLLICLLILGFGHYQTLNRIMKIIILILSATTIVAVVASFSAHAPSGGIKESFSFNAHDHLLFLIAFLGWMPAPLDLAIWHSLWTVADQKNRNMDVRRTLFDFNAGFWGTAILAVFFIVLGANVLYGSGMELDARAAVFAAQFMDMYSSLIGSWSYPVIALAAFTTMFSTTLTCLDASPRLLRRISQLAMAGNSPAKLPQIEEKSDRALYWFWILLLGAGTLILIGGFIENMRQMVNLATSISFVTTPLIALITFMAVKKALSFTRKGLMYINFSLFVLLAFAAFYLSTLF